MWCDYSSVVYATSALKYGQATVGCRVVNHANAVAVVAALVARVLLMGHYKNRQPTFHSQLLSRFR